MRSAIAFAALTSLLLGGCVLPPSVEPQEKPLSGEAIGLGGVNAPQASPAWWKAFGDPQLDDLVSRGLAHNPTLAQAMARMRGAQAQVAVAHSQMLPQVTLDGDEQRQRFSGTYVYPPPYAGNWNWIGSLDANLSWNIDFWGKQAALVAQAGSEEEAARLDAEGARLAISGALVQAYVALDRAFALSDIAVETEKQRQHILDLTRQRVTSGLDSKAEVKQAEALLAASRVAREQAMSGRDLALHEVAALAGEGANAYAAIKRPALQLGGALPLPEVLPADLLSRRPDVLAARMRVEAALSGRKAAKASFYPDINLKAFAGWAAIGLDSMLQAPSQNYGVGPAIHLPIFDGDRLKSQYVGATAEVDAAIAGYNGAVVEAVRNVADRLTETGSLAKQLDEQRQSLDAAKEAYRLAERRYAAGLSTYLSVLSAETLLLDARQQQAFIAAAQATNKVQLLLAVGGDFTPPARKLARSDTTTNTQ
ncbi:MAG: efflux transporter outer membrane subunit [Parvibaculum sedimenti]|uniref:efflux transporter outer membrane subunit n=1 Tax=Parvibaculum sedimenti TaxID=2608632 RepID=UPI003BB65AE3